MEIEQKILCHYRYRKEWREKYMTLDKIAALIRQGHYASRVNAVRNVSALQSEVGLISGTLAAEELPYFLPAKGRQGYTGIVALSFRVTGGQQALERLRQQVNVWQQTLLSFVGSSGLSLKVLIPYQLPDGTLPTEPQQVALFHQYAYLRAAEYAYQATGVRPEEVIHEGNEHIRMSMDAQVYINKDARPIKMSQPTEAMAAMSHKTDKTAEDTALDTEVLPGYTRREMDVVKYNAICRQMAYEEVADLDHHLMRLAVACRKAAIDQELAVKMTVEALDCMDKEILVRSTFNTAYQKHLLGRQHPVESSLMHQQLLEAFLKRRYMFRRNRVTGEIEVQEKYRYQLWWKPLTEEMRNDINNAAIREGIKVWPKDLERILVSEQVSDYDPVSEWLAHLPKWDGRDRLGEMARRVKTETPEWEENFRIWMRSMVSMWQSGVNTMYGAQMVLMLVGGQGTRKSTFMRMLLPRELMAYYIDRIDFTNKKEALRALSRFLLINIDEYDQISKSQTAFLKHLIQRTDVKERKLYTTTFEQQQRYAAFCATTNSLVPLKDESGSRRYMVVEVSGIIDTDTQGEKAIDYEQLYAQIKEDIARGEDYAFTGQREQRIIAHNADYYETPNVISLFEDRFHKPQHGEDHVLMSPTELLKALHVDTENRSNSTILGAYLRRNGFQKGDGYDRRRYQVALSTSVNL